MKKFLTPIVIIIAIATLCFGFDRIDRADPAGAAAIGQRTIIQQAANQVVTASTTAVATDLSTSLTVGQKCHIRYAVPFTLAGTASGIKFLVNAPGSPTTYVSSVEIFADDATLGLVSVITTEAAQGVTLANAGNHMAIIDVTVDNATAGALSLDFAQNVSDAGAVTILKGATAEITKY
jgi:hypothetical protein